MSHGEQSDCVLPSGCTKPEECGKAGHCLGNGEARSDDKHAPAPHETAVSVGSLYSREDQLERELAELRDHPIARMQVGPDGVVPTGTVNALELWKAEADRLHAELIEERAVRQRLDHAWDAMQPSFRRIAEALGWDGSPDVVCDQAASEIRKLRALIAPSAASTSEPVAWKFRRIGESAWTLSDIYQTAYERRDLYEVIPLFATSSASTSEHDTDHEQRWPNAETPEPAFDMMAELKKRLAPPTEGSIEDDIAQLIAGGSSTERRCPATFDHMPHDNCDGSAAVSHASTSVLETFLIRDNALDEAAKLIETLVMERKPGDDPDPEDQLFFDFCAEGAKQIRALKNTPIAASATRGRDG